MTSAALHSSTWPPYTGAYWAIQSQKLNAGERVSYINPPLGMIPWFRAFTLSTIFGSGSMPGLTNEGLYVILSRSPDNLVCHSADAETKTGDQVSQYSKLETRTIVEQLRDIRQSFGLNASDMANLLGVSRPTLYTWLDGQEPRAEATTRILDLAKLADSFANLGLRRPDNLIKRPLFEGGASAFTLLQQGQDIRPHFATLRALDEKEAASRNKVRGSTPPLRSFEETAAESTPAYSE